jgi:hypothetical protein
VISLRALTCNHTLYAAGDEAFAIETAPAIPPIVNEWPIVRPGTFGNHTSTFNVVRNWGNLSPLFSLHPGTWGLPDASPLVPEGCAINGVNILHRHGARYPTSGEAPAAFAAKLNSASNTVAGFSASGPLEFLNRWTYKLGAEILTPLGRQQMSVQLLPLRVALLTLERRYELGVNTRVRYGDLLKEAKDLPVWRTTSEG